MDANANPADQFKASVGSDAQPAKANTEQADKTAENKEPEKQDQPAKPTGEAGDKPNPQQEHDWKKRYDGTAQDLKEKAEDYDRAITANIKLVQQNPDLLDVIAETDKKMADNIAKKLYGSSYEENAEIKRIAKIRAENPDKADQEERLARLERNAKTQQESTKVKFLEAKGIMNNRFDPKYQKWEAQMNVLDKKFVESNYDRACEIAHNLAFPGGFTEEDLKKAKEEAILAAQASKGGGGAASEGGSSKRPLSPEAKSFNSQFNSLTKN